MKNKILLVVNLLLLLSVVFWTFNERTQAQKKDIWEYKTVNGAVDSGVDNLTLNSSGADGWELVTIETLPKSPWIQYVFKRKKQ